jgi:hypothetical protein
MAVAPVRYGKRPRPAPATPICSRSHLSTCATHPRCPREPMTNGASREKAPLDTHPRARTGWLTSPIHGVPWAPHLVPAGSFGLRRLVGHGGDVSSDCRAHVCAERAGPSLFAPSLAYSSIIASVARPIRSSRDDSAHTTSRCRARKGHRECREDQGPGQGDSVTGTGPGDAGGPPREPRSRPAGA